MPQTTKLAVVPSPGANVSELKARLKSLRGEAQQTAARFAADLAVLIRSADELVEIGADLLPPGIVEHARKFVKDNEKTPAMIHEFLRRSA